MGNWTIKIGRPGKFDTTFGLIRVEYPQLMEPLFAIVWLDNNERVPGIGAFIDPVVAEEFIKKNRQLLIDKEFEKVFLING